MIISQAPPTGDLAHNPGMYSDWESNWRPFGSQDGAQSTEVLKHVLKYKKFALAGVTQWTECRPANQRVAGLIPSQGTYLGCRPGSQ